MLYVYLTGGKQIPMTEWDGNGVISFSQKREIMVEFQDGNMVYPLSGIDWVQAYCLIHLGISFARYDVKRDVYIWHKTASEPLPRKIIEVPGTKVREWHKLYSLSKFL